jgi:hypothetical protein
MKKENTMRGDQGKSRDTFQRGRDPVNTWSSNLNGGLCKRFVGKDYADLPRTLFY